MRSSPRGARAATLLAIALAPACDERAPEVEFAATALTPAEWDTWEQAGIKSAHHEITVRRTMRTPSWCRHLDATGVRSGNELTLRVMATKVEEECPPGEGLWGYLAVIKDLPSGRYDLRVVHTYATPGRSAETVLRHPVLVE